MKFGFFLLSPQMERTRSAADVMADTIALAQEAESLGFDHLWVSEHHFGSLSLSPSPLMTLSHLAARTERIRLGTGVLVLPLHHPMRLAEEVAYVDGLSGGRLDLGLGAGSHYHEGRGLGVDLKADHDRFLEALDVLDMALSSGRVAFEGEHFQVPDCPMSIPSTQLPTPPIYVAGMSGDVRVTKRIAKRGYCVFTSLFGPAAGAPLEKREAVLQGFDAAGVAREQARFAGQRLIYVAADEDDARDAAVHARDTLRLVAALKAGTAEFTDHFATPPSDVTTPTVDDVLRDTLIGSPARVAELLLEDVRLLELEQFSCFMQFGTLSRDRIIGSMHRFMTEVVPQLNLNKQR